MSSSVWIEWKIPIKEQIAFRAERKGIILRAYNINVKAVLWVWCLVPGLLFAEVLYLALRTTTITR